MKNPTNDGLMYASIALVTLDAGLIGKAWWTHTNISLGMMCVIAYLGIMAGVFSFLAYLCGDD